MYLVLASLRLEWCSHHIATLLVNSMGLGYHLQYSYITLEKLSELASTEKISFTGSMPPGKLILNSH